MALNFSFLNYFTAAQEWLSVKPEIRCLLILPLLSQGPLGEEAAAATWLSKVGSDNVWRRFSWEGVFVFFVGIDRKLKMLSAGYIVCHFKHSALNKYRQQIRTRTDASCFRRLLSSEQ